MRIFLATVAAVGLMAGSANAFDWTSVSYGHDAAAWWAVQSSAAPVCLSGNSTDGGSSGNALVAPGDNGQGGTVVETDGTVTFGLQGPNDTILGATARIESEHALCNTSYTVNVHSDNGGLYNPDGAPASAPFLSTIPYDIRAAFEGVVVNTDSASATGAGVTSSASSGPGAGTFRIRLDVHPHNNRLMVAGDYDDFLKVTIAPAP